ncbi:MAG: bifunctional oligoribonuclease/PAP phosphatase NrnA [bacterium]|nr:bifunctional oligoribonuclease/PAP phosphatase NrnA [bacterium]
MKSSFAEILQALREGESYLVTAHINPDGDAIGSVLAMRNLLLALGKTDVQCAIDGEIPRTYRFLPGTEQIVPAANIRPGAQCAVVLDTGRRSRLGAVESAVAATDRVLVLDHHLDDDPEGDLCVADSTYGATGEMVLQMYETAGVELTPEMAECLYVAIATDTGGFRFSNTSARCHRAAAKLVEAGVDVEGISLRVFDAISPARFRLLRLYFDKLAFSDEGRIAFVGITRDDLNQVGAKDGDLENLVNLGRNVDGVEVAMLLRELESGVTKVSLRSRPTFNVKQIAEQFGGGGHAAAAGASLDAPMDAARESVLASIREHLTE